MTGIVTRQWFYSMPGVRCNTEIMLTANNISKQHRPHPRLEAEPEAVQMFCKFWREHADCPLLARNLLLQNVCPQLQGLCMVKLALMLMLVGGEQQVSKSGQSRAELHMLLVGDPGTGKLSSMPAEQTTVTTFVAANCIWRCQCIHHVLCRQVSVDAICC